MSAWSLLRPIFRGCDALETTSISNCLGITVEFGSTSTNEQAVLDDAVIVLLGDLDLTLLVGMLCQKLPRHKEAIRNVP